MDSDITWLSAAELRDWMAVVALLEALPAAMDAQLRRDAGINRYEYMVLAGLSERPDRSALMSELAVFASGSLSRLSHAVSRMEEQGWLQRSRCREGKRPHVRVTLTVAGLAKVQSAAPGHVGEARRLVVDVLTPTQMAALGCAARAIVEVADPHLADALPA